MASAAEAGVSASMPVNSAAAVSWRIGCSDIMFVIVVGPWAFFSLAACLADYC
jgi:hypothetical protein